MKFLLVLSSTAIVSTLLYGCSTNSSSQHPDQLVISGKNLVIVSDESHKGKLVLQGDNISVEGDVIQTKNSSELQ